MTDLDDLPRLAADLHIWDARPFGYVIDLYPLAPAARSFVISQGPEGVGFRPTRILLPGQLYTDSLKPGEATWVLPVLSSWYCVAGRSAGEWHP